MKRRELEEWLEKQVPGTQRTQRNEVMWVGNEKKLQQGTAMRVLELHQEIWHKFHSRCNFGKLFIFKYMHKQIWRLHLYVNKMSAQIIMYTSGTLKRIHLTKLKKAKTNLSEII